MLTASDTATLTAEMDAYLQAHQQTGRFMGAVAVMRSGELLFTQGYGMASLAHQVPNTPQTRFRIGSITKQFTAAAVLQLQERGLLDVQAPLSAYLPDYPQGERITLHHLLTHTSGIPNFTSLPDYEDWKRQPATSEQITARFQDLPLEFEPGEKFSYSNSGYLLLTQVIEAVSGQTYADYLQEHLLQPLAMADTGYEQPLAVIERMAQGYQFTGEGYLQADYLNMAIPQGGGGLYSTVEDLMRWNRFLLGEDPRPEVLEEASIALLTTPHIPMGSPGEGLFYGYGVIVNDHQGSRRIAHGGGIEGFVSLLAGAPELGNTVVVLSNVQSANPQAIADGLGAILQGEPYELPAQSEAVSIDPALLQRYVGTYQVTPEFQVTIRVKADQLQIQGTGQPSIPLYPASETEFFARVVEFRIVFNVAADGSVESATLVQNGQEITAPKAN